MAACKNHVLIYLSANAHVGKMDVLRTPKLHLILIGDLRTVSPYGPFYVLIIVYSILCRVKSANSWPNISKSSVGPKCSVGGRVL